MKTIIINADDFGITTGCNLGIIKALKEGIVTSTTIMMNMPKTQQGIESLKNNNINSLGIHLNIVHGSPLLSSSKVSSLVDEGGKFKQIDHLLLYAVADEIEKELKMQIDCFLGYGLKLTHLDSHVSIHMRDKIKHIFFKLAKEYNLPLRKIQYSRRKFIISSINKWRDDKLYTTTNGFSSEFYGDKVSIETIKNIIRKAPKGITEIMTHPGYFDEELMAISDYNKERVKELEILTSKDMINWIRNQNIKLVSYEDIFKE